ncbi:MAG: hypothetical protein AAB801_03160 [Patescibacteria group bacterium]
MDPKIKADSSLVKDFETKKSFSLSPKTIAIYLILIAVGIGTGFVLSNGAKSTSPAPSSSSAVSEGATYGSKDTKIFKDSAEGKLEEGGIEGEGQYHLVRPGGESQNVYLTSSTVDLSLFLGRKIKVWGETQKAQYAGWFMDVGRVEVLE